MSKFKMGMKICIKPRSSPGVSMVEKIVAFGSLHLETPLDVDVDVGDPIEEVSGGERRVLRTSAHGDGEDDPAQLDSSNTPSTSSDDARSTGGRSGDYKSSGKSLKIGKPPRR